MLKKAGGEGYNQENEQVQWIMQLIFDMLSNPNPSREIPVNLRNNTVFQDLYVCLIDIREAMMTLSKGELSKDISGKGFVVAHLKDLQANLRHLTWQTKRISQGDLTQRVDFMGDFAESFNAMVDSLAIARADLEKLASIDPLTQCANRRYTFKAGYHEVRRAQRHKRTLSMLALDLDYFKKINDTFGHSVGDQVLQVTADIFRRASRTTDIIGRIGGEEFAIILPETPVPGALIIAERILSDCRSARITLDDSRIVTFTISIGVAWMQEGNLDFEQLLQRADKALYAAKQAGRDQISIFGLTGSVDTGSTAK
jgi:diguanylate cyclase (GGDEF)-like protein